MSDIENALRTFIESGSANRDEAMRRKLLKMVPIMASAPDLLAQCEWALTLISGTLPTVDCSKIRDAIAKAKGIK